MSFEYLGVTLTNDCVEEMEINKRIARGSKSAGTLKCDMANG